MGNRRRPLPPLEAWRGAWPVRFPASPQRVCWVCYQSDPRTTSVTSCLTIYSGPDHDRIIHKTRLRYIGIRDHTADGEHVGILLQRGKENLPAVLVAAGRLEAGIPISGRVRDAPEAGYRARELYCNLRWSSRIPLHINHLAFLAFPGGR